MNDRRFNYFQALSSSTNVTIPLPTAFGYPSNYIVVLDAVCASYSASNATTANNGIMRVNVKTNGSATANIVWAKSCDIYTTLTGTSGLNFGGFTWAVDGGIPLWNTIAGSASQPGIHSTAYRIDFSFSGGTPATAGAAVDLAMSWHYADPATLN